MATYLPEFAANGKAGGDGAPAADPHLGLRRLAAAVEQLARPRPRGSRPSCDAADQPAPGTTYLYSDLNLITLGVLVERLTGEPLDQVVHDRITGPLGMSDTGYNPDRR